MEPDTEELMGMVENIVAEMEGWCSVSKAKYLVSAILREKPKLIVEIGVFAGRSLIPMALAAKSNNLASPEFKSRVIGIDSYQNEASLEGELSAVDMAWWGREDLHLAFDQAKEAIDRHGVAGCCDIIHKTSEQAAKDFADQTIDLLHIDGCHSEFSSTRDVDLWFPKVRPGGFIVLDDTDWVTVQAARRMLTDRATITRITKTWEVFMVPLTAPGDPSPVV